MQQFDTSPWSLLHSGLKHRNLLWMMISREISSRYKGSIIGALWLILIPLMMLFVYSFVFGDILNARWSDGSSSSQKGDFTLALFVGLIVFGFFADCINRAPSLIVSNVNYVKKVVFPLEIMPVVSVISSVINMSVGFLIWAFFYFYLYGSVNLTFVFFPVILLPFYIFSLGLVYLLSALGVFLRDINQVIGVIVSGLMFLSPVFYEADRFPEQYRIYIDMNPLTVPIESMRSLLMKGDLPDLLSWMVYLFFSLVIFSLSYLLFQKARRGFADVL